MIALERVSVRLGEFSLQNINLRVNRGEYFLVMGPSGAGKTVLLETIAGLRALDSGRILVHGNDTSFTPPEHRHVAIVYQDYSLFPHLTVAENIAYGMKIQKRPAREISNRVDGLLSDFKVSSLKNRYPGSLSGGEQQRVAMARALAVNPDILLLDEPFAALDPQTREECMRMMLELQKSRDLTILQVSHSREEAYVVGDRIALLIDGMIIQTGSADEIFHSPKNPAAAKYAGIDNIFRGKVLRCDGIFCIVDIDGHQISLLGTAEVGSQVTLCIDGEQITLGEKTDATTDTSMNAISVTVSDILPMEHTAKIRLAGAIPLTAVIKRDIGPLPPPSQGNHFVALFRPEDVLLLDEEGE